MTNTQLYLAIGIPMLFNTFLTTALIGFLWAHMDRRFEDLKDVWRSELRRVEEILDARLKHLEEKP